MSSQHTFINLVAWSQIVVGTLGAILSVLQIVLALFLEWSGVLDSIIEQLLVLQFSAWLPWLLRHLPGLSMAMLVLSTLILISGYGLLQRHEWARLLTVTIMWFGCLSNGLGIWVQSQLLSDLHQHAQTLPNLLATMVKTHYWTVQISNTLLGVVFATGFAWTGWKFATLAIRNQFSHH